MDRAQVETLERLLGGPLDNDPAQARVQLRQAIRARSDDRAKARDVVRRGPVVETALDAVALDRLLSTSPELERLRTLAESLVLRRDRARHRSDKALFFLESAIASIRKDVAAEGSGVKPDAEVEPEEESPIPGAAAMRTMIDRYRELRVRTNRIGTEVEGA